eukprot:CAMPEP_0119137034 /NCGR_PEP_ID=MMETSP1310-20130426/22738_1 /TAXON_ID=464262 /ORGANISM="Genus nov. species nov., Strain RCC2339" /LENGTH=143 /DNA_ID=CAMNT_0007128085 /DNA_START=32 /DNA_END=463 /DNA_ORIENTATION=-
MGDSDGEYGDGLGSPKGKGDDYLMKEMEEEDVNMDAEEVEGEELATLEIGVPGEKPRAIPKHERTTSRFMTKYERARILGTRALQLSMNAPALVQLEPGETDPLQIAMKELRENKIPIIIRRYLPHGDYEDWAVDELYVEDRR